MNGDATARPGGPPSPCSQMGRVGLFPRRGRPWGSIWGLGVGWRRNGFEQLPQVLKEQQVADERGKL